MSRWLVGMSGDKDAMIRHLEKCEKRMLEQFAEIEAERSSRSGWTDRIDALAARWLA